MSNTTTNGFDIGVRVRPVEDKGNLKAFASLTFSNEGFGDFFAVNGVKVVEGKNGLIVGMPRAKNKNDEYHDVCFPVTADFRKLLNAAVLSEYERAVADKVTDKPSIMQPLEKAAKDKAIAPPAAESVAKKRPGVEL